MPRYRLTPRFDPSLDPSLLARLAVSAALGSRASRLGVRGHKYIPLNDMTPNTTTCGTRKPPELKVEVRRLRLSQVKEKEPVSGAASGRAQSSLLTCRRPGPIGG